MNEIVILNEIALRRASKVHVHLSDQPFDGMVMIQQVGTVVANMLTLGFTPDTSLLAAMSQLSMPALTSFNSWIMTALAQRVGADKKYTPMYPNFPRQVAEASEAELFINAILHYFGDWIGFRILPHYDKEPRPDLDAILVDKKVIGFLTEEGLREIFLSILGAKSSPSEADKKDIDTFLFFGAKVPEMEIPCKETMAYAAAKALTMNSPAALNLFRAATTATDLLRIAVALSDGDVSLAQNTKFKSFARRERRLFLSSLNVLDPVNAGEDMMRHREAWKRLGERLHPGEFKAQYPAALEAFRLIRNEGVQSFASKIDGALSQNETKTLVDLLTSRPGEFARRMDHALRKTAPPERAALIERFGSVADKVSTPVLWQMYAHFSTHMVKQAMPNRIFFPKGQTTKPMQAPNTLHNLGIEADRVSKKIACKLVQRYSELPKLGKVYIDPIIEGLTVPSGNRSASASLRQVGRGSSFALPQGTGCVRLFAWWHDIKDKDSYNGRVDLDLSAVAYDEDWNFVDHCSWTNLRQAGTNHSGYAFLHSGDITSAPDGASEFMDINLRKLPKNYRYVVITVTSYTGQKFAELGEAFVGWMARKNPGSGEIYEPRTVVDRIDLRSECTVSAPMVLDVLTGQVIWADLSLSGGVARRVGNMWKNVGLAGDAVTRLTWSAPRLSDVFLAHVQGRGGMLVHDREEADLVIAPDGDVSPFDTAKIMSEWV